MYKSQYGQDKWLSENLFAGKRDGFFVDIGAGDGIIISNTWAFEQAGWKGICIEPHSETFPRLQKNRTAKAVNCLVMDYNGEAAFNQVNENVASLSYFSSIYEPNNKNSGVKQVMVPCKTLETILDLNGCPELIDYVSIDTEGSEILILSKFFEETTRKVSVFSIERNTEDYAQRLANLMGPRGYKKVATVGIDDIYVR
jgi:FkbM family methyltransferase